MHLTVHCVRPTRANTHTDDCSSQLAAFLRDTVAMFDPERVDHVDDFLEYSEHFMLGSSQAELQVCMF
jgi:hypothetical protein